MKIIYKICMILTLFARKLSIFWVDITEPKKLVIDPANGLL